MTTEINTNSENIKYDDFDFRSVDFELYKRDLTSSLPFIRPFSFIATTARELVQVQMEDSSKSEHAKKGLVHTHSEEIANLALTITSLCLLVFGLMVFQSTIVEGVHFFLDHYTHKEYLYLIPFFIAGNIARYTHTTAVDNSNTPLKIEVYAKALASLPLLYSLYLMDPIAQEALILAKKDTFEMLVTGFFICSSLFIFYTLIYYGLTKPLMISCSFALIAIRSELEKHPKRVKLRAIAITTPSILALILVALHLTGGSTIFGEGRAKFTLKDLAFFISMQVSAISLALHYTYVTTSNKLNSKSSDTLKFHTVWVAALALVIYVTQNYSPTYATSIARLARKLDPAMILALMSVTLILALALSLLYAIKKSKNSYAKTNLPLSIAANAFVATSTVAIINQPLLGNISWP
ncbi:hypothetical protein F7U66_01645 [Vibrio parahaemolyticus]|nr:hypothetical protein [Vibrio parahaemolyticus]